MTKTVEYECGLCKEEERVKMARHTMREHLKKEHKHRKELFNDPIKLSGYKGLEKGKHSWIIRKEVNE